MNTNPDDLEAAGISVQAVHVPVSHEKWLDDWDGAAVCPTGGPVVPPLKGEALRRLLTQPELCLLSHAEGRLLTMGRGEFSTPPRPNLHEGPQRPVEDFQQKANPEDHVPSDLELWAQYEEEKARSGDSASAIALLATAYEQEPDAIRAAIMRCLERDTPLTPVRMDPEDPPLPPPRLLAQDTPPNAAGPATPTTSAASALVRPKVTPGTNPLLAAAGQASAKFGEPRPQTKDSLVASLFPKRESSNQRNSGGSLWSGLPSKAGATFTEALGGHPSTEGDASSLATDRITHALDGLRKAQDEDKTGTKGTLASLKEGEKLDVFLARGCGQLTIEVCEGVYGKELFHSLKRVGHHAKHELLLLKWPVEKRTGWRWPSPAFGGEAKIPTLYLPLTVRQPEQIK